MNPLYLIPIVVVIVAVAAALIVFGFPGGKRQQRAAAIRRWTATMSDVRGGSNLEALMKFNSAMHDMQMHNFGPENIGFPNKNHLAFICATAYANGIAELQLGDRGYTHKGEMLEALERFSEEQGLSIPFVARK